MSPVPQPRGGKISPSSDTYTALLAVATGVLLATMVYVTYACYTRYEVIFGLP
jgi:hypothetical protein